ncbi:MAG: dTMP kinase [Bradymonadaceae bacterium]
MEADTSAARPAFLAVEGLDGAGTTTQTRLLVERLNADGREAIRTREPSDGPIGTLIRQMLGMRVVTPDGEGGFEAVDRDVLALLFAADRLDHVDAEIAPALDDGRIVVTDRYYHSSFAYQADTGEEHGALDTDWVRTLNERALEPDLTLFLQASPEVCLDRLSERGRRDIYENREELESLHRRYEAVVDELVADGEQVVRIDAERSIDAVHDEIVEQVRSTVL